MKRLQRVVLVFATLLGITASVVVVAAPAQAYTPFSCQTRTWTANSEPHPQMSFWPSGSLDGFWKWGHYYVSECRHGVRWDPNGFRTNTNGNLQVRIRTYNANGNTWYTTDWVTSLGSGNTVVVAGFVQPGTRFSIEAKYTGTVTEDVRAHPWNYWPWGQIEF